MRLSATQHAVDSRFLSGAIRNATSKNRDIVEASNIEQARISLMKSKEAGAAGNWAEAQQGLVDAANTAGMAAAGIAACFPPVGTFVAAGILIAIAIMNLINLISQKAQKDDVNETKTEAGEAKILADMGEGQVRRMEDRMTREAEDAEALAEQTRENLRREYDAAHPG